MNLFWLSGNIGKMSTPPTIADTLQTERWGTTICQSLHSFFYGTVISWESSLWATWCLFWDWYFRKVKGEEGLNRLSFLWVQLNYFGYKWLLCVRFEYNYYNHLFQVLNIWATPLLPSNMSSIAESLRMKAQTIKSNQFPTR